MIGYLESFIVGDVVDKFEGLLLEARLGSVVGIVLGFNEDTKLGFWDGKVLEKIPWALVGI